MTLWATRLAALATGGAAFLVLLLYAPALEAPFLVPKFAALELAATVALLAFGLRGVRPGRARWARPLTLGAVLVVATSAASWAWAETTAMGCPYALAAVARWGALLGLACGASVLDDSPAARQRVLETISIAAAAVATIGLLQHIEACPLSIPIISTPGSTFGNRNLAAEVMAMALPLGVSAALGAQRRDARWAMLAAIGLELVYLAVTRARGAWLGGACGLGAALWLSRIRFSRASLGAAVGAVVLAGAAAIVPGRFNPRDAGDAKRYSGLVGVLEGGFDARSTALKTRLGLWRRTGAMIRDHAMAGVGPGNWPRVFPRYAEPDAARDEVLSPTLAPRQAHEDYLERAAETGIPGLLALCALGIGVAIAARDRLRARDGEVHVVAGAAGAWVALGALCFASFPFEMPGTLALAGIALGLVAGDVRPRAPRAAAGGPFAHASVVAGLVLLPCVAVRIERSVHGSAWLGVAERALRLDHGAPGATQALDALSRATQVAPTDFRAKLRTAQMQLRLRHWRESAQAATEALGLEPYSPNALVARAAATLEGGDARAAREDATQALGLLHDYPLALHVRARAATQERDTPTADTDLTRLNQLAQGAGTAEAAREARALLAEER